MARKPTIAKFFREKLESKRRIAQSYRQEAKRVQEQRKEFAGMEFPDLDCLQLYHNGFNFSFEYNPQSPEHAKQIRASVGQLLGISNWERKVDQYNGNITFEAKYGNGHTIKIRGGELAPGCKLVEYTETVEQKRFKTVCGETT